MPIRLQKNIKEKTVKNIGKYRFPFFFTFSAIKLSKTNSYKYSIIRCHGLGINVEFAIPKE